MPDARRTRIEELGAQAKYSAAVEPAAGQLAALLGFAVGHDDAVSMDAVEETLSAIRIQQKGHLVWHRVWGVRLRDEMIEVLDRLADLFPHERATLVWGRHPAVGFSVPLDATIRMLSQRIGPAPEGQRVGTGISDFILAAEDGKSGLRLTYEHGANADEYALVSWGRYARSLGSTA